MALVAAACSLEPIGSRVATEAAVETDGAAPTPTPSLSGLAEESDGEGEEAAEGDTPPDDEEAGDGDDEFSAGSRWAVQGTPGELNVRGAPNTDSPPVGTLAEGDVVTATGEVDDTWVEVSAPLEGWVFSTFLEPAGPGQAEDEEDDGVEAGSRWTVFGTPGTLNVRPAPNTNQAPIGAVGEDDVVIATGNASGSWIEIESPAGWVYTAYLRPGS